MITLSDGSQITEDKAFEYIFDVTSSPNIVSDCCFVSIIGGRCSHCLDGCGEVDLNLCETCKGKLDDYGDCHSCP